ncbi:MAG: PQQ-dependent dehydrogenase, methanol/ethanol family [Candidatus Rokuibacteriota bacterium]|nr:MAG: PQQ-dependent dehydrogenase, methanol/ethanol family [Candidatus Rokubacteria bacterium]
MSVRRLAILSFAVLVALEPAMLTAQSTVSYSTVTEQRLLNPEPHNWLMYRGTLNGWGYSPLDQVTPANVKKLVPVWTFSTGVNEGHQSPPIVNNGVMFVTTPQQQVLALNAKTGDLLWRYKKELPEDLLQLHPTNRGVALWEDRLFLATVDAHLIALDAKTGAVLWDTTVDNYKNGYYFTLAPLVAKGKVMIGTSGGELGIRGYVAAFDAKDGKQVWKTHTIPGPGEPGHDTWPGETWKTGGVSVWLTAHYDPQLNLSYWGTGNAAPWMGDMRPGDNLYSSSVIALDVDTGKIRAHHQYHWNDSWDWDEVSTPLLIDFPKDGRTVKGLVHPGRNGYLWRLERGADSIKFVDARPFVTQEVFTKLDPVTGRPSYNEERKPRAGATVTFCPGLWGGKDWTPAGYNPKTQYLYIPAHENLCSTLVGQPKPDPYEPGKLYLGIDRPKTTMSWRQGASHIGELQAWDMTTGQRVWTHKFPSMNWGPILTTGGGLVFLGGTNDRNFWAFDAKTGAELWKFKTNSGITGVPSSFAVDGVQYVAVQSGWGIDAQRMQARLDTFRGTKTEVPQGGVIWVFALRD